MLRVEVQNAAIPSVGFGTWELAGDTARRMVQAALEAGYRHIDTAQIYGNEREVGEGIRASRVRRDDVFLTTKVWMDRFRDGDLQRSAEESLARLGVANVDLLLLHWPNPEVPLRETVRALSDAKARGLTRHIGVSNFTTKLLDEAVAHAREPIVTNQVEYHPFIDQSEVLAACRAHGLSLTAYSPLAKGRVFGDPVVEEVARRHGRTAGQVAIRWLVQQPDVIAIPRSSKPEHARANLDVMDFALSEDDMDRISRLGTRQGRLVNPAWSPRWD